jgi:hypothetical protein
MVTFAYPLFQKIFSSTSGHTFIFQFSGRSLKNYTGKMVTFAYPLFQKIISSTFSFCFSIPSWLGVNNKHSSIIPICIIILFQKNCLSEYQYHYNPYPSRPYLPRSVP